MKEFKGYKCDHCGKLYQIKHACEKHENISCRKHPKNDHRCWHCPHIQVSIEDLFVGDCPYSGEEWRKQKTFYCKKKEVNLYSHHFDKHIASYDPAQSDESKSIIRMPSKLNPCEDFEEYNYSHDATGEFF